MDKIVKHFTTLSGLNKPNALANDFGCWTSEKFEICDAFSLSLPYLMKCRKSVKCDIIRNSL